MSKVQLTPSPKKSLSLILCIVFLAAVVLAVVGFVGKNAALTEKAALNVQLEDTLAQLEESKAEAEAKAAELEQQAAVLNEELDQLLSQARAAAEQAGGAAADFAGDGGVGVLCAQNQFLIGGVDPALFGS